MTVSSRLRQATDRPAAQRHRRHRLRQHHDQSHLDREGRRRVSANLSWRSADDGRSAVRRCHARRAERDRGNRRALRPKNSGWRPNHHAQSGGQGDPNTGVDIYISTSSAGGGLQMMVTGVVQNMTGESAQRAALGAGAIVIDVLASNDGRLPHEKIERIRTMRPDMILMSGGTDGGAVTHVVEMAEYIAAAEPRPRFGAPIRLPLVYAGNKDAQPQVKKILGEKTALELTDNIRPVLERENLAPARNKIHDLFLEHVMQQAPGYKKLIEMAGAPIMPTPAAVGVIMETIAKREASEPDRRRHRRRDDRRVLGLRGSSSIARSAPTSACRTVSPTCWRKRGSTTSCAGCRSRSTNRRSATGSRTRWSGPRRFRNRSTNCRSNMRSRARPCGWR